MNFSGLRVGCRHGLSDEEKKNTSENLNFELHLVVLADSGNIAALLILFFSPQPRGVEPTIDKDK